MSQFARYPSLEGRTVLITGGGSGIGEAITRHFCDQGSRVAFIDIAKAPSEALVASLRDENQPLFVECDLRDIAALRDAVAQVQEALGTITVLVNNAAHDERHAWDKVTPEYWDDRFAVNLRHQFFAAQAVAPGMIEAGGGSIINFGSTSWMMGLGGMAAYTAAKSAVLGLSRSLARDLGPHNIRVNSIAPGWIMTERQQTLWLDAAGEKLLMERQCLKRKLYPDEMARLVLFLAADDSSAITNQSYVADGGWV